MKKLDIRDLDLSQLMGILRNVDFFSSMTIGEIERVLPYIMLYEYNEGEVVFKEGDLGDCFYIIREGSVMVTVKRGVLWMKKKLATLESRQFFGEMALISDERRTATITCLEVTQLFALNVKDFKYLIKKNPEFSDEVDRIMNLRKTDTKNKLN